MRRALITLLGIAILAGAAIFIMRQFLKPAAEKAERKEPVLTGAYDVRLDSCRVLEDHELPEGLEPPGVGDESLYLLVVALYPGRDNAPPAEQHFLGRVNGEAEGTLRPVHSSSEVAADGQYISLVFRAPPEFESARLMHEDKTLVERVTLD